MHLFVFILLKIKDSSFFLFFNTFSFDLISAVRLQFVYKNDSEAKYDYEAILSSSQDMKESEALTFSLVQEILLHSRQIFWRHYEMLSKGEEIVGKFIYYFSAFLIGFQ